MLIIMAALASPEVRKFGVIKNLTEIQLGYKDDIPLKTFPK